MKALVLSGGKGTRLRPFTHSMSKQLVPVSNKPVLLHCLENLAHVGIRDIGIIIGEDGDEIENEFGDGTGILDGINLTYIKQSSPLGLAHCVVIADSFLGDDDFVMYLGDNILRDGIGEAQKDFKLSDADAQILVKEVDNPSQYGIVDIDGGNTVQALVEKPSRPTSRLAVMGVYFFRSTIKFACRAISPSARGELEITDAIQEILNNGGKVIAKEYSGYWKDAGTIDDIIDCNRTLLGEQSTSIQGYVDAESRIWGAVNIDEGAHVKGSDLVGPLSIGSGSSIEDSYIDSYTTIGNSCSVVSAEVRNSILLEGCRIEGVKNLSDSIVGRWAHVKHTTRDSQRILISDHSSAEVLN